MRACCTVRCLGEQRQQQQDSLNFWADSSPIQLCTNTPSGIPPARLLRAVRGLPKAPAPAAAAFDPWGGLALGGGAVVDESSCKVCTLQHLYFEPPALYCYGCGQRIKRSQVYHGMPLAHELKGVWCHPCFTDIKSDLMPLEGWTVRKAELEKRKNDVEVRRRCGGGGLCGVRLWVAVGWVCVRPP